MFDKKRRIAQLEEALADKDRLFNIQQTGWRESNERVTALQNQIEYLVRTIREMDDQIFKMSQCSSWEAMRPNFNRLQEGMTARKVVESNRISDLIRPELIRTYAPKQIESK